MHDRVRRRRPRAGARRSKSLRFRSGGRSRVLGNIFGRILSIPRSSHFAVLGVLLYVALHAIDFFVVFTFTSFENPDDFTLFRTIESDPQRILSGEIHKRVVLVVYVMAALMFLAHLKPLLNFVRKNLHFVVMYVVLLLGLFWSIEPVEVLTRVIQLGVATVIAICFALSNGAQAHQVLWKCVLFPLVLIHIASLYLFFFSVGENYADYVGSPLRFGGVAGHPNTLGYQCVFGTWAALMLLLRENLAWYWRVGCLAAVALFLSTLLLTDSATSIIGFALVCVGTAGLWWIAKLRQEIRLLATAVAMLVLLTSAGIYFTQFTVDDAVGGLTSSVDRDTTFTGRTELWATAVAAIKERPILGWGYDGHATVTSFRAFEIPVIHYHNGFLDTLVSGGLLLGCVVLFELLRFMVMGGRAAVHRPERMGLLMTGFLLLIFNLSEYTILRPFSIVYFFYLCAWALLRQGELEANEPVPSKRRVRKSRKRRALAF